MPLTEQFGDATRTYVLVTPAKNESATVGATIASVVGQQLRPVEWVIVSDGSTDQTDAIVRSAAADHPWIRLVTLPPREVRSFAAVVHATELGVRSLQTRDYAFIGLLDADVRFAADYFSAVIGEFESDPSLGLAGGVVIDPGEDRSRAPRNQEDVPGAVQFFRRSCFEALGGLIAVPEGGWDGLTCAKARMQGFRTRLLTHLVVDHLKPRNISQGGTLRRRWQMGVRDYAVGCDPLFELVKCASRLAERPAVLGTTAWGCGYVAAALRRQPRQVPIELAAFIRSEQRRRLTRLWTSGQAAAQSTGKP